MAFPLQGGNLHSFWTEYGAKTHLSTSVSEISPLGTDDFRAAA
jgi:hypothetical protein